MRSIVLSLYGSALFLSAMLLFSVQPMMAKMLLPFLGGTPAVWNTCMVIFQALLLAGYGYAHLSAKFLRPATQGALHLCLLVIPLATLPLAISQTAVQKIPIDSNPALWLVACLVSSAGLPFVLIATTSPLLQKWFSNTAHPMAKDPYFLYAAGNLGSLLALLGYPLLMEPTLRLAEQSRWWAFGYGLLALLIGLCWATQFKWRANLRSNSFRHEMEASHEPGVGRASSREPGAYASSNASARQESRPTSKELVHGLEACAKQMETSHEQPEKSRLLTPALPTNLEVGTTSTSSAQHLSKAASSDAVERVPTLLVQGFKERIFITGNLSSIEEERETNAGQRFMGREQVQLEQEGFQEPTSGGGAQSSARNSDPMRRSDSPPPPSDNRNERPAGAESSRHWPQPVRWILCAFVPSSLMLGVTTYLTTDIASIPLLWVLPLSFYLLSLVFVFSRRNILRREWMARALPFGAVGLTYLLVSEATHPIWLAIALHLLFFFIAAMVCHGRLADARPPVDRLTEFYFWTSVGGVLGGLFNTLVAPALFTRVMEYPIAIVLTCLLRPATAWRRKTQIAAEEQCFNGLAGATGPIENLAQAGPFSISSSPAQDNSSIRRTSEGWDCKSLDIFLPVGLGLLTWLLAMATRHAQHWPVQVHLAMSFGLPAALSYTLVDRPHRFALAIGAVLCASALASSQHGRALHAERNFFGVLRVTMDPDGPFRRLVHGNTIHGRQAIDPMRQDEPLAYYHRTGPLGQIFAVFNRKTNSAEVAVVGLGMGSMLAYAEPRQHWTIYEINPAMVRLARTTNYFSFVTRSRAGSVETILGDARLRLREAAPSRFDMIVLDAFSSDAIPLHLITREALELYASKLAPGGMLAFHISNRCLDLAPVLANLAAESRLVCLSHDEVEPSEWERASGKEQSHWLVMARSREDLGRLVKDSRWIPIARQPAARIWTDDFSNIISVFKWQ